MFDGSLDSQFQGYSEPQREAIYAFQRTYGALRVTKVDDTTSDIIIEGLDRTPTRRVVEVKRVQPNGRQRRV